MTTALARNHNNFLGCAVEEDDNHLSGDEAGPVVTVEDLDAQQTEH